jgi:hypothetical protein
MSIHDPQNLCHSFPYIYTTKNTKTLSFMQQHLRALHSMHYLSPTKGNHKTSIIHCHAFNIGIVSITSAFNMLKISGPKNTNIRALFSRKDPHPSSTLGTIPIVIFLSNKEDALPYLAGSNKFKQKKELKIKYKKQNHSSVKLKLKKTICLQKTKEIKVSLPSNEPIPSHQPN